MSSTTDSFTLGREGGDDGSFQRQDSRFRGWVQDAPGAEFPLQPGRYHLYVARACPWAHRTLIGRRADGTAGRDRGLLRQTRCATSAAGRSTTAATATRSTTSPSSPRPTATDPDYEDRVSVPVLWDRERGVIVNNESADILRMLETVFAPLAAHPVELYPEALRGEIDALGDEIYESVNNAVYKAGLRQSPGRLRA